MTPIEYLWHHRLVVAKKFLEFTNLPIKDVAARCGFKTTQHFSRKFEETVGVNPTAFRIAEVSRRKKSF
jgi:AraC family transcriptional regulator of arabinose operon